MSIIQNKKAFHDFFIEEKFEAGLVLEGWEVKSIRAGRVQLKESYVIIKQGAIWLIGWITCASSRRMAFIRAFCA